MQELARNVGKVPAGAIEDLQRQLGDINQKSKKGTATASASWTKRSSWLAVCEDQNEMKDIMVKLQKPLSSSCHRLLASVCLQRCPGGCFPT